MSAFGLRKRFNHLIIVPSYLSEAVRAFADILKLVESFTLTNGYKIKGMEDEYSR